MSNWTPGPWHFRAPPPGSDAGNPWVVLDHDSHVLAIVPRSPREANGCLIAAAPDLYKALYELGDAVLQWMDNDSDIPEEVLEAATDALKKARGAA